MPRDKKGKNIMGAIVNYLRLKKDSKVCISLGEMASKLDCSASAVYYSLTKLKRTGIVNVLSERQSEPDHRVKIIELELVPAYEYKKGDDWREALKRKSSGGKAEAGSSVAPQSSGQSSKTGMHDERCLEVRKALLEELADVYGKLKTCQEEKQALHDENKNLQERKRELEEGADKRAEANRQLRQNVQELEGRVKKLRVQTSQVPTTGRSLRFDGSGVIILPGEGLPDRS